MDNHRNSQRSEPSPPDVFQYRYPRDGTTNYQSSSSRSSQFLGTYGDMSLLEGGLSKQKYGDITDNYHKIHAKLGKMVDPKLLMLLEFVRELYFRRREMFKKLFSKIHDDDDFEVEFKKIRNILLEKSGGQVNNNTRGVLRRSLSVGSPRTRSIDGNEPLRLERFKVKTIFSGGSIDGNEPLRLERLKFKTKVPGGSIDGNKSLRLRRLKVKTIVPSGLIDGNEPLRLECGSIDGNEPLRLERFKFKTIFPGDGVRGGVASGGGGEGSGQVDIKSTGSTSK